MRQIGNALEKVLERGLQLFQLLLRLHEQRLELLALLHELCHVVAFRLGLADVLGDAVARGLRLLHGGLQLLARRLEALELVEVERPRPARSEPTRYLLRVLPQQLDVDHRRLLTASALRRRKSSIRCLIFSSSPRPVGLYHSTAGMPSGK